MSARILAVDDDPDILAVVRAVLEVEGWKVVTCSDPRQVRQLVDRHRPAALILDVNMPHLSGLEVLRELRSAEGPGTLPILFLSARAEAEDRIRGLRLGADDYLGKPFAPEELVLRIGRLAGDPLQVASPGDIARLLREAHSPEERPSIGRYRVEALIGEGSMGAVFRGFDPMLKRQVALKTLRFTDDRVGPEERRRFGLLLREAVTVARFAHPNIVTIFDVGESPVPYLALELVDGRGLDQVLGPDRRLPAATTAWVGIRVARGLEAAHARGVLHRDVKPGNVLVGAEEVVKIADFGLADVMGSVAIEGGSVYGTVGYIAPEVLAGEPYSPASDIFSLGATLYRVLAARPAVPGRTLADRIRNTGRKLPPPVRHLEPRTPAGLSDLVHAMMSPLPADRPASVGEVAAALARWEHAPQEGWHLAGTGAAVEATSQVITRTELERVLDSTGD